MKLSLPAAAPGLLALAASAGFPLAPDAVAQELIECGGGSYASYAPWRLARSTRHWGDQSRIMQTRPVYMTDRRKGEPIPTNDWWTDALVSRWTGNLWSYPAKVRIGADGVRVANPSYWIDNGTEMKERGALLVGVAGDFNPEAALVDDWHDWDVSMVLRDGGKEKREDGQGEREIKATLVHGSPFTWIEAKGVSLALSIENDAGLPVKRRNSQGGEIISIGDEVYGVWKGKNKSGEWMAVAALPDESAAARLAPYAAAVIRSTRVDWKYDEKTALLSTVWNVETEDLRGTAGSVALQGFQPHHLKNTKPHFKCMDGLVWQTPRGKQRVAAGNSLSIDYTFPGMLPYWAAPAVTREEGRGKRKSERGRYDETLFKELVSDYAARGTFGGDTYWGGKGLLQMAFAMMAARELGDEETFRKAHGKLRRKFEDWLAWDPGEERFFFSYVPRWGGMVGEGTSYDSDAFNDHHFHYGYFTYSGALLCLVDGDFREKFGPMLRLIAKDYACWKRPRGVKSHSAADPAFPFFRTFDPWAGHSFAGGVGDWNGNGQESTSEAMQGWGGLYLLGLALDDREMRDAGIFGYVSEARAVAEYWFDRDRKNIDYTKFDHPYNSNLTCHGVGWWTYFSGDPVWMHSIQWLPNTPALDYLSEDLKFAKWDWDQMWEKKEIGGWFEKGRDRNGNQTGCVGDESLGNVLLSYLQRHNPREAAEVFDALREKRLGAAMNADTGHMTYWATHSHLTWGELDFGIRADYPCARAFVKDGKRTLMVYNASGKPRTVAFFDAGTGEAAGTVEAKPRGLTVASAPEGRPYPSNALDPSALALSAEKPPLVPKGVVMPDLAAGKETSVSSQENGGLGGGNLTDGDDATRWGSAHDDTDMTAAVDLGGTVELYAVELKWENSFAAKYLLQISPDGVKWTTVGGERSGFAGLQRLYLGGEKARWVRVKGLEKATQYGISLFRFSVYGKPAGARRDAPLGLAVESAAPVLKEDVPCALSAKAWMGGAKFREMEATWTSDDGTFSGNDFTPSTNGFATVAAGAGGLTVEKRFPVEEALKVATLSFASSNIVAVVGEDFKIDIKAKDQFGGDMPLKGIKVAVAAPDGKKAVPGKDCKSFKGGRMVMLKPGAFKIYAKLQGVLAACEVKSVALKDANLARLASVAASGEENGGLAARFAADGDVTTRWGSRHKDGEWIVFDFGRARTVSSAAITWENARAEAYKIETTVDGAKWHEVVSVSDNDKNETLDTWRPVKAHKLRITGLKRNTSYGISIFEVEIK